MKRMQVFGLVVLVLFAPLMTIIIQRAIASPDPDPMVGLGYIFDVDSTMTYDLIVQGSQDGTGKWIVNPGVTYLVTLREVEYNYASISVHGSYTDASKWEIIIGTDIAASGTELRGTDSTWYYWFTVTIPSGAGCTITIHYKQGPSDTSGNPNSETHVAAETRAASWVPGTSDPTQYAGKLKNYYPTGGAVPCVAPGVPEFPFVSAVVTSLGLIGALLIRRRQKKLK